MKRSSVLSAILVAIALCAAMFGCSSGNTVAATVNGANILESQINDEIQAFRLQNELVDDDAWDSWLSQNNLTEESYREQVLNGLIDDEVIVQAAKERGIEVSQDEIDNYIANAKSAYESEDAWAEALRSSGVSEQKYANNVKISLLEAALQESIAASGVDVDPTDEQILAYFQEHRDYYDGAKRSSHIVFDENDGDKAADVLQRIRAGELTFAEAAAQYSVDVNTKDDGGDMGWNILRAYSDSYEDTLDGLNVDEISEVIDTDFGKEIVMCTDIFNAPKTVKKVSTIPDEIVAEIEQSVSGDSDTTIFDEWLEEYRNGLEIIIF